MYDLGVPNVLVFVSFLVLGGVSYLIWWKAKAPAALLMLVGFGVCWLVQSLAWLNILGYESYHLVEWLFTLGLIVAAGGFVLTFWTKIQADVERFSEMARDKLAHAAQKGTGVDAPAPEQPTENP